MLPKAVTSPQSRKEIDMTKQITTECRTLGEFINKHYADFNKSFFGSAPMDMDMTHGAEVEVLDNSKQGYGITVHIYPYVKWSDGCYKPCHYWGSEYYVTLERK